MRRFFTSRALLGLILCLFGIFLFFGSFNEKTEVSAEYTFKDEPVDVTFSVVESTDKPLPVRILIPKLDVDLEVKKSDIVAGYWEVFNDTAGWGQGSGYPGETGNQVIFAHAREGLFLPLKDIQVGEKILVFTAEKWYEYEVTEIKEVFPNETEVIAPTEDETLTLYTCSGFNDSKRLIVVSKRRF